MKSLIPTLREETDSCKAAEWLRQVIAEIGPCFHYDTLAEEYCSFDGEPLLSKSDCQRLTEGLDRAISILDFATFEDICLEAVWEQAGVRYDRRLNELVSIV